MKTAFAFLILTTGLAHAEPVFDIATTLDCLAAQGDEGDRNQCVGMSSGLCMENDYSTVGMSYCLEQEWIWWDGELNAAYKVAMANAKASDAELQAPLNVQAAGLRDMQRAWIAFRDAKCNWEASLWQGGTGSGPAQIACLMYETGRQAINLQILGTAE